MSDKCPHHVCPICARISESIIGSELAAPAGSAWDHVNAVFAEADKLEELTKLRMERPGETGESAFEWAKEMYQRYSPNDQSEPRRK